MEIKMDNKGKKIDDKTRDAIKANKAIKINSNEIIKKNHGDSSI